MKLLRRMSFLSIVALLLGCSGAKTDEKVRSEWQLQNRGDNTCLYDDNGIYKTGRIPSDDSYKRNVHKL
ncbi:hypothetical protein EZS27_007398 [termite gut metagenome]|uniref:Lipoprotein n=1 Tax=termite gut metagenome TaxID=433724 RepID=A0A5J4SIC5_9ZZZZ